MNVLTKIPVTVITGFLGSGKTTLIRHLMRHAGGRRLAIVVNEFGTVGIDGDILKSCADESCSADRIIELANGCICCTVADDFIPTIETMMAMTPRPDHILIETSGLALPKPLLKAFDWPAIRSRITVDGVVAVADAQAVNAGLFAPGAVSSDTATESGSSAVDHETPLAEVFEDQVACADLVLLSKADLVDPRDLEEARRQILAVTPRHLPVLPVIDGAIDARIVLGLGAAAEDDVAIRPSHHDGEGDHEHDDFASVVIELPEIGDPDHFVALLRRLAQEHKILRAKGYVAVMGKPMRMLVQAVGERVRAQFDRPWGTAPRRSQLVVIAERGDLDPQAIRAMLGA